MNRKHLMSVAIHDKNSLHFIQQSYATTYNYDDKRENELRAQCCKNGEATWVSLDITKFYDKTQRSTSICLNKRQAEALRDLLNNALGGSSRIARTIGGSLYSYAQMTEVK